MKIDDKSQTPSNSNIVLAVANELGWNQEWNTQSESAILLTQNGKSSQEWHSIFVDGNYDYALLPGFPGDARPCGDSVILESLKNKALAKSAMFSCDQSMALLIGPTMSLGT